MKNTKSFLTAAEAKALNLPSNEEQIANHNRLMESLRQEALKMATRKLEVR